MTSMLEGQEGLDWWNSPMLQYFKHNFVVNFTLSLYHWKQSTNIGEG